MEKIFINGESENIISYLDKHTIVSYRFLPDNTVENIGEKIYEYFDFLKGPSPEKSLKLPNEGNYEVILNTDTNFKHYYLNGKQDFSMFFINNGEESILYLGINKLLEKLKKSKIPRTFKLPNGKTLTTSFISLLLVATFGLNIPNINIIQEITKAPSESSESKISQVMKSVSGTVQLVVNTGVPYILEVLLNNPLEKDEYFLKYYGKEITPTDVKQWYIDAKLPEDVINYLYDEQYLADILPLVNSDEHAKQVFFIRNHGIIIVNTDKDGLSDDNGGYVMAFSSTIHLPSYTYKDGVVSSPHNLFHENFHLGQVGILYKALDEAGAEIYTEEYKNDSVVAYREIVKSVKKLMETIGTEPVRRYLHIGDKTLLKKSVKPYLTEKQYSDLMTALTDCNEKSAKKIEEITYYLYEQIYKKNPESNMIFKLIDGNELRDRHYFNSASKNDSYYIDSSEVEKKEGINIKDGLSSGEISIEVNFRDLVTPSDRDYSKYLQENPGNNYTNTIIDNNIYREKDKTFSNIEDLYTFLEKLGSLHENDSSYISIRIRSPYKCIASQSFKGSGYMPLIKQYVSGQVLNYDMYKKVYLAPPPACIPDLVEELEQNPAYTIIIPNYEMISHSRQK